jgi:alcohol dehydrogenase (cytochrome c)
MKVLTLIRTRPLLAAFLLALGLFVAVLAVPRLRWRVEVVALHLAGQIPDISLRETIEFMMPGSDQSIARLPETRNPHALVKNYRTSEADVAAGAQVYRDHCAACHAPNGTGGPGAPSLVGREFRHGSGDWAVFRTIRLGVPNTAMQPHDFPTERMWQLVAFLRSLDTPGGAAASAAAPLEVRVSAAELEAVAAPGDDWLTFSGSYRSTRHSTLGDITPDNVRQLGVRWVAQFPGRGGKVLASPLVRNGVMYVTVPEGLVFAIDAVTGRKLWHLQRIPPSTAAAGEFGVALNRGVALLDDVVYVGTGDAHVLALSANTGKVLWETATTEDIAHYFISSAPLAYRDLVVVGVGTKGGRGFVLALDAKTGKERWRFMAIPGPGEFGNDTWGKDGWREGGAPTWLTGSFDAENNLLLWGVGNPKPDYDTSVRPGDNLYSNSAIALDAATGKLKWHFQFTPADERDWDSNQIPVLADLPTAGGATEKLVLWANRNGFYYVLDRLTGKFLGATPFARQTWTDGIDAKGRPLPRADMERLRGGYIVYPGNVGATNWWPPSFDPELGLIYVPVLEQGMVFFPTDKSYPTATNQSFYTAVRALEARTGKQVWEYRRPPRNVDNGMAGLVSTATGLLFGSDQTSFFALSSRTGEPLWSIETGGQIGAAPITYRSGGDQYVVISSERILMAFALPRAPVPEVLTRAGSGAAPPRAR